MKRPGNLDEKLACPACAGPVQRREGGFRCPACSAEYGERHGVADLMPSDAGDDHHDDHHHDDGHGHEHGFETDYHKDNALTGPLTSSAVQGLFALLRHTLQTESARLGRRVDVVDVGCGSLLGGQGPGQGRLYRSLDESARSYVGVEPSWGMIEDVVCGADPAIEHLEDARLVRGVGEHIPLVAQSSDVVLILSTLDHATSWEAVVHEVRRVLRPRGLLFCSLQNYESWQRAVAGRVAPGFVARRRAADHHSPILAGDLRTKLESVGFDDIVVHDAGYLTGLSPRFARVEAALSWLPQLVLAPAAFDRVTHRIDQVVSRVAPHKGASFYTIARTPS